MLKFMRKHAKFFYFFFFIIIISFVFFYVGPIDKSQNLVVVKINGDRIYAEEFWRTFENLRRYYSERTQIDEAMEKRLKEEALEALINDRILSRIANEFGIEVSDKEVEDAVVNNPLFMKNGVFSKDLYISILRQNRLTPEIYEQSLRKSLRIAKLRRLIEGAAELEGSLTISGENELARALREAVLFEEKDKLLKSYINGFKNYMKIEKNAEFLKSEGLI
ncbi:MAG: SurA N-terminal domain-containing protein [Thermodesulfovibrionales bacterium]|nr:SurA N-terminal domain-containing protein [Thermodesulfovibrionales bacterium]